jgi:ferric-dicitrate binding protein FerR (iron transport regulator)
MDTRQRINDLFEKYLNGTCTQAEWEELMVLIDGLAEEEFELLDTSLQKLWLKAGTGELPSRSKIADREKIYASIVNHDHVPEAPVRAIKWKTWAVAAAVIGALIISGIYYKYNVKTEQPIAKNSTPEKIKPGINKAVLTLANGKRVVLDSSANGARYQQGKAIALNQNGALSYHTASDEKAAPSYNDVTTARANEYHLTLPDGTKVWLNASSSLHFPTTFNADSRTVELKGEAYFEVAKDKTKPFHVMVNGTEVVVLGTHFNINAYDDEAELKTSLLEGSVKINHQVKSSILKPGQEANVTRNGELNIADANVELAVAWKNGFFQFDRASLPAIMRQISRWYDLDIVYSGKIPDRLFKGKIQRSLPLSGILNILKKGDVNFNLNGHTLTVLE